MRSGKFLATTIHEYLKESVEYYDDFFITFNEDRYVSHITSEKNANDIMKNGFKTGYDSTFLE